MTYAVGTVAYQSPCHKPRQQAKQRSQAGPSAPEQQKLPARLLATTTLLFQAPDTLSREDVLAMAEGMSYTP